MELSWWFSACKTSLNIKEALINLNWSQCGWKWRCVFISCWDDRMNYIRNLTPRRTGNSWKSTAARKAHWGINRCFFAEKEQHWWCVMLMFGRCTSATARAGAGWVSPKPRAPGLSCAATPQQVGDKDWPEQSQERQEGPRWSRQEQQDVGPETGLEMRLQQRSRDHLEGLRQTQLGQGPGKGRRAKMSGVWTELWERREEGEFREFAEETAQGAEFCDSKTWSSVIWDEKKKFPVKSNFGTSSFIAGINSDILTCLWEDLILVSPSDFRIILLSVVLAVVLWHVSPHFYGKIICFYCNF